AFARDTTEEGRCVSSAICALRFAIESTVSDRANEAYHAHTNSCNASCYSIRGDADEAIACWSLAHEAMRWDFDRLLQKSVVENWSNSSAVRVEILGVLWPRGEPRSFIAYNALAKAREVIRNSNSKYTAEAPSGTDSSTDRTPPGANAGAVGDCEMSRDKSLDWTRVTLLVLMDL